MTRSLAATERLVVLLLSAVGVSYASAQTTPPPGPAHVAVVGNDYSFVDFPPTLPLGPTTFSFENRGQVKHEMSMVLLQPGVTVEQVLQRIQTAPGALASRALADRTVGILIARAGESAGGQLLADLLPGRTYFVVCTLKDAPDARPHLELGMMASFVVP